MAFEHERHEDTRATVRRDPGFFDEAVLAPEIEVVTAFELRERPGQQRQGCAEADAAATPRGGERSSPQALPTAASAMPMWRLFGFCHAGYPGSAESSQAIGKSPSAPASPVIAVNAAANAVE